MLTLELAGCNDFGPILNAGGAPVTIQLAGGSCCGFNTSPITSGSSTPYGTYPLQIRPIIVPGGAMGINGQLDVEFDFTNNNSANAKDAWATFSGVILGSKNTVTTTVEGSTKISIRNQGAANSQFYRVTNTCGGVTTVSTGTLSIDTTKNQQLCIFMDTNAPSDIITPQGFNISVTNPPATPARTPLVPGKKTFYGINHHFDYPGTYAQIIAFMKQMGMTVMRVTWEGATATNSNGQTSLQYMTGLAQAFQADGTGLQLYACIDISADSTPGTAYASEAAAYSAYYTTGQQVATALMPAGVILYEVGNELDTKSVGGVGVKGSVASEGTTAADYNSVTFPPLRGAIRGTMDGIRSIQPNSLCAMNPGCNADIEFTDCLYNGTQPDGTTGYNQIRWDITAWHFYTEGDGTSVYYSGSPGAVPSFNMLNYLANAYGCPVMITETNPDLSTEALNATCATNWLTTWYDDQDVDNIAGVMWYQAIGNGVPGDFGITPSFSPVALTPTGTAIKNFIAAHPAQR